MFKLLVKEYCIQSYFREKSKLARLVENLGCALQGIAEKRISGATISVQGLLGNKKICKVFLQIDRLLVTLIELVGQPKGKTPILSVS